MISTKDLTFSALMMYGVFPIKNGKFTTEEIKNRLLNINQQKYTVSKVLASALSKKIYGKLNQYTSKTNKEIDLLSQSVLTSTLVVGMEYFLIDGMKYDISLYTNTFLLHIAGAYVNTKIPISDKKII